MERLNYTLEKRSENQEKKFTTCVNEREESGMVKMMKTNEVSCLKYGSYQKRGKKESADR